MIWTTGAGRSQQQATAIAEGSVINLATIVDRRLRTNG
jgi:hypothetical protein